MAEEGGESVGGVFRNQVVFSSTVGDGGGWTRIGSRKNSNPEKARKTRRLSDLRCPLCWVAFFDRKNYGAGTKVCVSLFHRKVSNSLSSKKQLNASKH